MEQTQDDVVKEKIIRDGEVSNFWAIRNNILRLGAVIFRLRRAGMELRGAFGKELGKERSEWKNYYYTLVKKEQGKMF